MKAIKTIRRVVGYPLVIVGAIFTIIGMIITGDGDVWYDGI